MVAARTPVPPCSMSDGNNDAYRIGTWVGSFQVPLSCFLAPGYTTTLPPERMADIACYIFEREG